VDKRREKVVGGQVVQKRKKGGVTVNSRTEGGNGDYCYSVFKKGRGKGRSTTTTVDV